MNDNNTFQVMFTGDFTLPNGSLRYREIGTSVFTPYPFIKATHFAEHHAEIRPEQCRGAQGIIVLGARVTRDTLVDSHDLLAVGRFGVGYDGVDVQACSDADVLVLITPGAVDRPVAEATVGWMLALSHNMFMKDRLVRVGQWNEAARYIGCELRDRTLGIIGLGRIGRAVVALLAGFGMNPPLAFDPYADPEVATALGVRVVSLDELLSHADFVSIHCMLNDETRGLIGARELGLMKPDAYLINVARGGIVDEDALYDTLANRRIAGAAVDCFVGEPITWPHRFGDLDNILLAPHSIAITHELVRDIGQMICGSMLDLALRRPPRGAVNPELLERPSFQQKWQRLTRGLPTHAD